MAGRVARRCNNANARGDFCIIVDELPVFPRWEDVGDPFAGGAAPFSQLFDTARPQT
jgi:hypothetical protein